MSHANAQPGPDIVRLIEVLDPFAESIRAMYHSLVDPSPVCGWLAMLSELRRISLSTCDPRAMRAGMFIAGLHHDARTRGATGR